jgi:phosphoserine phosphatase
VRAKLVALDFDSTLVQEESLNMLAASIGKEEEVSKITHRAMSGDLEFEESLRLRLNLFAGLNIEELNSVAGLMTPSPGAVDLIHFCKENQISLAIISGGFLEVINSFSLRPNFDFVYANSLKVLDGKLTGEIDNFSITRSGKAAALTEIATRMKINRDNILAIGDGANDLEMLEFAGMSVSFRGHEILDSVVDLKIEDSLEEVIPHLQVF